MKIKLGFSPCPNDTFIFDALVNGRIDTEGLEFEVFLEDVQTLNEWTIDGKLDACKISYATLPLVLEQYAAIHSGGALGKGVGPLLISRTEIPDSAVKQCMIAIPGQNTTANVLFSIAYPEATHKVFLRYDEIENFVASSEDTPEDITTTKLGVIIHENRFTYASRGLKKIADLGEFWVTETRLPIPLGCIAVSRRFPLEIQRKIEKLIRKSLEFARREYPQLSEFIKENAQEMKEDVMRKHIDLYVNDFSLDVGREGKEAVQKFIKVHSSINKIPVNLDDIFIH